MQVFYTPATAQRVPVIIDTAENGLGRFSGETLEQIQVRYPGALLGDLETVVAEKEAMLRTEPTQITEAQFMDALECLPPLDYQQRGAGCSFKCEERLSGRMTSIYASVGNPSTYWTFVDLDTTPHAEIMARVAKAYHS